PGLARAELFILKVERLRRQQRMRHGMRSNFKLSIRAQPHHLVGGQRSVGLPSLRCEAVPLEQLIENTPPEVVVERLQLFVELKICGTLGCIGVIQKLDSARRSATWGIGPGRLVHNSFQFIPPEFASPSYVAGRQEEGRRSVRAHE